MLAAYIVIVSSSTRSVSLLTSQGAGDSPEFLWAGAQLLQRGSPIHVSITSDQIADQLFHYIRICLKNTISYRISTSLPISNELIFIPDGLQGVLRESSCPVTVIHDGNNRPASRNQRFR